MWHINVEIIHFKYLCTTVLSFETYAGFRIEGSLYIYYINIIKYWQEDTRTYHICCVTRIKFYWIEAIPILTE